MDCRTVRKIISASLASSATTASAFSPAKSFRYNSHVFEKRDGNDAFNNLKIPVFSTVNRLEITITSTRLVPVVQSAAILSAMARKCIYRYDLIQSFFTASLYGCRLDEVDSSIFSICSNNDRVRLFGILDAAPDRANTPMETLRCTWTELTRAKGTMIKMTVSVLLPPANFKYFFFPFFFLLPYRRYK